MNVSTRGRYGLRAMVEIAAQENNKPLHVKAIAGRQEIPIDYLSQILHTLRKAKLVKSVRGVHGGFNLAKKPSEITVKDILKALEKSLSPVECVDSPGDCNRVNYCVTRVIWKKLKKSIMEVLEKTTLEELVKEHLKKK